jgi:hypothetical protein
MVWACLLEELVIKYYMINIVSLIFYFYGGFHFSVHRGYLVSFLYKIYRLGDLMSRIMRISLKLVDCCRFLA